MLCVVGSVQLLLCRWWGGACRSTRDATAVGCQLGPFQPISMVFRGVPMWPSQARFRALGPKEESPKCKCIRMHNFVHEVEVSATRNFFVARMSAPKKPSVQSSGFSDS